VGAGWGQLLLIESADARRHDFLRAGRRRLSAEESLTSTGGGQASVSFPWNN